MRKIIKTKENNTKEGKAGNTNKQNDALERL